LAIPGGFPEDFRRIPEIAEFRDSRGRIRAAAQPLRWNISKEAESEQEGVGGRRNRRRRRII